ncbi:MAG: Smr/MutS family protein [Roseicyclus sp.]|nr:Smr/MutS family protein [Roseicyclus sp.]
MARRGKRGLSEDDKALWNRVAATATPMDRRGAPKITTELAQSPTQMLRSEPPKAAEPLPMFRIGEKANQNERFVSQTATRPAQAPIRMDHGTHKRMSRGKLKPEGRLDLHGMILSEAQPALISFIFQAYEAEKRLVLIITGKGKDRDSGGPIPVRHGILRHHVPGWLSAPPLGALILDIGEAHRRHGGSGAYYIYLKRRR